MARRWQGALVIVVIAGITIAIVVGMKGKAEGGSGAISRQALAATLRGFVARYRPTEMQVTETRETESRYRWLAELKSRFGWSLARGGLRSVEYVYTINETQFVVQTEQLKQQVVALRIYPGDCPAEMSAWLLAELRKCSPSLVIEVGGKPEL